MNRKTHILDYKNNRGTQSKTVFKICEGIWCSSFYVYEFDVVVHNFFLLWRYHNDISVLMPLTNSYLTTILVHMLWQSGELHILAPWALLFITVPVHVLACGDKTAGTVLLQKYAYFMRSFDGCRWFKLISFIDWPNYAIQNSRRDFNFLQRHIVISVWWLFCAMILSLISVQHIQWCHCVSCLGLNLNHQILP